MYIDYLVMGFTVSFAVDLLQKFRLNQQLRKSWR